MNIALCLKQVPTIEKEVPMQDKKLVREGLVFHLNESDEYALEQALLIKDKIPNTSVTALTFGQETAREVLNVALAKGADKAIQIVGWTGDHGPMATAEILSEEIRKLSSSIVLTGVQSEDLGFGQVGIFLAEKLGFAHVSFVTDIDREPLLSSPTVSPDKITVTRELGSGRTARVEVRTPCVLTIQTSKIRPRYATIARLMQAKRKPVDVVRPSNLPQPLDLAVEEFFAPITRRKSEPMRGDPQVAAQKLAEWLAQRGLI